MNSTDTATVPDQPAPRIPRAQVRERILAAAETEFIQRGYRGASLARIARRAGFTKGAVYSNFESKQTLLVAMLAGRSARTSRGALDRLSAAGGEADLAARAAQMLAGEVVDNRDANLLLAELALHAVTDPQAARSYAAFRRDQIDALATALADHGPALGLRADADVHGAAFLLVTTMWALAVEHAADPAGTDRTRIGSALATVLTALIARAGAPRGP